MTDMLTDDGNRYRFSVALTVEGARESRTTAANLAALHSTQFKLSGIAGPTNMRTGCLEFSAIKKAAVLSARSTFLPLLFRVVIVTRTLSQCYHAVDRGRAN